MLIVNRYVGHATLKPTMGEQMEFNLGLRSEPSKPARSHASTSIASPSLQPLRTLPDTPPQVSLAEEQLLLCL